MKNTTLKSKVAHGFSLIEMLVVIAVIGVIAAIAIPNIGNINESATTAKNQRNAQNIVSVYQAGKAAGVVWSGTTATALATDVISGNKSPALGAFKGQVFSVPNMNITDDLPGAVGFMEVVNNQLTYKPTGATTTTTGASTGG